MLAPEFELEVFVKRLRELMKDDGISAHKLEGKTGISDTIIHNWLNHTYYPKVNHIFTLARYFKVRSDYLIGLED